MLSIKALKSVFIDGKVARKDGDSWHPAPAVPRPTDPFNTTRNNPIYCIFSWIYKSVDDLEVNVGVV